MQFRDADKRNLLNIATQLAVAHVLERNVQRVANRVRVTAQLVNARTDSHVWADQFDGEVADVFAIQSEIAQKIASALKAALSPKEQAALDAKPTLDLAAYDLYLRAAEAVNARPQDAKAVMVLALIDAALGRKDEPAREGERAIELLPVTSDAVDGAILVGRLSTVYAEIGDTDPSVEHLEKAAVLPHSLHYGDLKLDERFDSIRKDGRFEKILASLAPK
jgi:tetratricopeptide (TPR) repeat protein